jgi:hypothetical protein
MNKMAEQDMSKIMEMELRKVREYPRYHFHSFVFANEVDAARKRLKLAGIEFRTKPVVRNGMVVGYNLFTRG